MEFLQHIFAFNSESPLLFTQLYFWGFFALVYLVFAIIMEMRTKTDHGQSHLRLHLRNVFLMLMSWFFYYKTSGLFLLILTTVTTTDFFIAKGIHRAQNSQRTLMAKCLLALSVVIDLGFLFYYKYAYFGVDVFNTVFGTHCTIVDKIILPVGISFYIFQVISYTVDVYRRQISPVHNWFDFAFYVSFFPQLVAGPIVRANEFIPQLYKPFHLSRYQFGMAVFWVINGLAKKIILSDYLAVNLVDRVFDNPLLFSGFENMFALFAYSMQVYADFSGYTDIAIGIALMMGFRLPQNFDSPYKSRNPQEFWRRWHQSLSRWLKSYVYIPLGGNRTILGRETNKLLASNVNSFATMLLGGLWHGASWNFVIWGGLNGIGMIVNKVWRGWNWHWKALSMALMTAIPWIAYAIWHLPVWNMFRIWTVIILAVTLLRYIWWLITKKEIAQWLATVWAIAQTFTFITFTRLFFRSSSNLDPATASQVAWETAKNMVNQIGGAWNNSIILPFIGEYHKVVILFVLGMIIHWLPTRWKRWYRINFAMLPLWAMVLGVVAVIFVVYQFVSAEMQPFIYFQF